MADKPPDNLKEIQTMLTQLQAGVSEALTGLSELRSRKPDESTREQIVGVQSKLDSLSELLEGFRRGQTETQNENPDSDPWGLWSFWGLPEGSRSADDPGE